MIISPFQALPTANSCHTKRAVPSERMNHVETMTALYVKARQLLVTDVHRFTNARRRH
jgi:hypothetical protein